MFVFIEKFGMQWTNVKMPWKKIKEFASICLNSHTAFDSSWFIINSVPLKRADSGIYFHIFLSITLFRQLPLKMADFVIF